MINFSQRIKSTGGRNYYITSDLHFWHKNILKHYPDTRPWSDVEEMNQALIDEINKTVGPLDVLFHIGDFSFKGKEATQKILDQINCKAVFVLGNHDKVLECMNVQPHRYLEVRYNNHKVCMFHFPIASWNQMGRGAVHFFGHCHGSLEGLGRCVDVGWDAHGRILSLDEAVEMCLNKDIETIDYHKTVKEEKLNG